ncbi:MAG: restriction endonuclease subunit S [Butyrivibrio sp.]|nr:restriction endonuclease subunit S [Butyrivibrio sp.]
MNYKLSDICEYASGKVYVSTLDEGTYISTENMIPNKGGITSASSLPTVAQTQAFIAGDVLVSNIRPYFKKIWYAEFDGGCSNDVLVFRAKNGVSSRFLYYLLADDKFFDYSMATSKGTKMPRGDKESIMKYDVPDFTYDKQEKMAEILEAIDKKIQLNSKINDNLELQAQALFKSWFLDYEPWNGKVPNSWINGKLGDFADIKRGSSPRPIQEYLSESGLRWLKISDVTSLQTPFVIDIKDHIIEEGLKKTVFLKAGSLVLSNSATPGVPKILDVDSCIHDGWLYFPESKFSREYLYLFFKYIRQQLVNLSNGSVFNNLKTDILKGYPTVLPDEETLLRFDEIVQPMFLQMQNLTRESHRLAETRDAILPQLMSGELDVSNLDI